MLDCDWLAKLKSSQTEVKEEYAAIKGVSITNEKEERTADREIAILQDTISNVFGACGRNLASSDWKDACNVDDEPLCFLLCLSIKVFTTISL